MKVVILYLHNNNNKKYMILSCISSILSCISSIDSTTYCCTKVKMDKYEFIYFIIPLKMYARNINHSGYFHWAQNVWVWMKAAPTRTHNAFSAACISMLKIVSFLYTVRACSMWGWMQQWNMGRSTHLLWEVVSFILFFSEHIWMFPVESLGCHNRPPNIINVCFYHCFVYFIKFSHRNLYSQSRIILLALQ